MRWESNRHKGTITAEENGKDYYLVKIENQAPFIFNRLITDIFVYGL